jgi:hypothetical protein
LGLAGLCWAVTVVLRVRYAEARQPGRLAAAVIHWVYATEGEKDWVAVGPVLSVAVRPGSVLANPGGEQAVEHRCPSPASTLIASSDIVQLQRSAAAGRTNL